MRLKHTEFSSLQRQISTVFIFKLLGAALAFLAQLLLARKLGITNYGTLIYVLTILNFATLIVKVGFDNTCMRYVSIYRANRSWGYLVGFMVVAFSIVFVNGSLAGVSLKPIEDAVDFIPDFYDTHFPALLGLLPLLPLQNILAAVLRGLGAQGHAEFLEGVFRQIVLIMLITLTAVSLSRLEVDEALLAYLIATLATVLLGIFLIARKWPREFQVERARFRLKEWFDATTGLWFSGGMYFLLSQSDVLMLGALSTENQVAGYGVASRLTGILGMGLATVTIVMAPRIAKMSGRDVPKREIQEQLTSATKALVLFVFSVSFILIVIGKPVLLLFGKDFVFAYAPLLVLVFSRAIEATAGPAGQLLAMSGHHWYVNRVLAVAIGLNLTMNWFFIPEWGALGAAMATVISHAIWNFLLVRYAWMRLDLNPSILPRNPKGIEL